MMNPVCYFCPNANFPQCISALAHKQATIIEVDTHDNFELAKTKGLKTFTTNKDLRDFADFALTRNVFLMKKVNLKAIQATSYEEIRELQKSNVVIVEVKEVPLKIEVIQFFALATLENPTKEQSGLILRVENSIDIPFWAPFNYPFSIVNFQPTTELLIGQYLREKKARISILEATTGGLISSSLLSVPGASSFFISGAIVYTGRGAKRILPPDVLKASELFDREKNYRDKESYVESKITYCQVVSKAMRIAMKADYALVESGTSGPEFYIKGVETGFTAVGISGPNDIQLVRVFESSTKDRTQNMIEFCNFALDCLKEILTLVPSEKTSGL